jgi:hypothetical protein
MHRLGNRERTVTVTEFAAWDGANSTSSTFSKWTWRGLGRVGALEIQAWLGSFGLEWAAAARFIPRPRPRADVRVLDESLMKLVKRHGYDLVADRLIALKPKASP